MPPRRRLWDSSVVIGHLAGQTEFAEVCPQILEQASRGETQIVVSTMAATEVAYLEGLSDPDSEAKIREFLGRDYIVLVALDVRVASMARDLVRRYRNGPRLKPADAIHLATALHLSIPILETTDPDLLRLDRLVGDPPITIRRPLYEGPNRIPGIP